MTDPAAAGNTYLVGDGEVVSTSDLLRALSKALGVSSRLFALPVGLVSRAGALFGKVDQVERLVGSLQWIAVRFTASWVGHRLIACGRVWVKQ